MLTATYKGEDEDFASVMTIFDSGTNMLRFPAL